jgi:hypothetical protein
MVSSVDSELNPLAGLVVIERRERSSGNRELAIRIAALSDPLEREEQGVTPREAFLLTHRYRDCEWLMAPPAELEQQAFDAVLRTAGRSRQLCVGHLVRTDWRWRIDTGRQLCTQSCESAWRLIAQCQQHPLGTGAADSRDLPRERRPKTE